MSADLFRKTTAWLLASLFWTLPLTALPNHAILGMVAGSEDATLGEIALPNTGTILNNDLLTTGQQGQALLEFFPAGRATVFASTWICFRKEGNRVTAEITLGAMVVESQDLMVTTSNYRIAPAGQEMTIFYVALMPDRSTVVAARRGRVAIAEGRSGPTYFLPEGQYASIPATAPTLPGQPDHGKKKSSKSPTGTWHIGSLSHKASLGVVAAIAAGVAGWTAIPLSAGGHVASPIAP
jgi:hypothetical protein